MKLLRIAVIAVAAMGAIGCNSPTAPTGEAGEAHGPEGLGGESGESGTQFALTDTAMETRNGVDLVVNYDSAREVFTGTVSNTTAATVTQVRVEVHLSNGMELGPTPRTDVAAGQTISIELDARGQTFSLVQRPR